MVNLFHSQPVIDSQVVDSDTLERVSYCQHNWERLFQLTADIRRRVSPRLARGIVGGVGSHLWLLGRTKNN